MIPIFVRGVSTVVAVVISVAVAAFVGESAWGKVAAAVLIAVVIGAIEWLVVWLPKHSVVARRLLDPRSQHLGVWLQVVRRVVGAGEGDVEADSNRFAVYWVSYEDKSYQVHGFAYDADAREQARWQSQKAVAFSGDGSTMTYQWAGEIVGKSSDPGDIERTGVASLDLTSGTGRVDHVGQRRVLLFDVERVTPELLKRCQLAQLAPDDLKQTLNRRSFVEHFAQFADANAPTKVPGR